MNRGGIVSGGGLAASDEMEMLRGFLIAALLGILPGIAYAQVAPNSEMAPPHPDALFPEPPPIGKLIGFIDERTADKSEPSDGLAVTTGGMITGAGFVSAGPAYRAHLFNRRAVFQASAVLSVKLYNAARTTIEVPHMYGRPVKVGATWHYQDALQVNYFGLGNASSASARSGYRLRSHDVMGYAVAGTRELSLTARVGLLRPVRVSSMAGREPGYPDTVRVFSNATAPGLDAGSSFVHADLALTADTRDNAGHPTDGGIYQASMATFNAQRGGTRFQRFEIEAAHYVRLRWKPWTLALRGWIVGTRAADRSAVPLYLTPNLGGRNLRGYADYRFHDLSMHAYSAESRWAVFRHVDTAVFADVGAVAPSMRQLTRASLKQSYGVGIRLHNDRATLARLDVAHSREGWRVVFRMNDPFRHSVQTAGRPPLLPFVP